MTIDDMVLHIISQYETRFEILVDRVSSNLCYIGMSKDSNAITTDSQTIIKVYRLGNLYKTEKVNFAVWNNRVNYFSAQNTDNVKSIYFDGISKYLDAGDNFTFERTIAFSISFWIKPQNTSATRYLISKVSNDVATNGYRIGIDNNGKIIIQARTPISAFAPITFNTTISAGTWTHVCITYTGVSNLNGFRVYVNGFPDSYIPSSAAIGGAWVNTAPLTVGQSKNSNHFVGNIDEISFWNKSLSSSEANEIYNSGQANDLEQHSSNNNLLSWYRCGDGDTYPTILDNKGSINMTMMNMNANDIQDDVA